MNATNTKQALSIGWASRDVSTTEPLNIPGQFHMRISQGIIDPITVTALAIDNGEDSVIFLSADIVVIRAHLLDRIRERVAELDAGVPVMKILMNATHTHTAPTTYGERSAWRPGSDDVDGPPHEGVEIASAAKYQDFFVNESAEAVVEAWKKRAPGGVAYGYGFAVVAHSRREVYFDDISKRPGMERNSRHGVHGHAMMYGSTRDPMFSHYEAGTDPFINLLYTFDAQGRLTGAIVNVPCPAQNSEGERRLSASYWHEAREAIRKQYGNIFILPQCAAGGDLSPRIQHYHKAEERRFALKYGDNNPKNVSEYGRRLDIGERIAAAFTEVLEWARKDIRTALPLQHSVETVHLSRRMISDEDVNQARAELAELEKEPFKTDGDPIQRLDHNSTLVAGRNRYRGIIARYEKQATEPKLPMEMHVLHLGEVAFASNRFELYMDYMHRIQARSPFTQTFVVQLAGTPGPEGGSYLATERGVWGRGYSASIYCNVVSPQGGQDLVEATLATLNKLYEKNAEQEKNNA
ncbi:MAG: hypothetical protein GX174_13415 [Lentisphaerae bacterium]|jgi:hypothetical protein|nr:hypothetical protein [Lentisphaerota bacterium]